MSQSYITISARETMALSLAKGIKVPEIARLLGKNKSSIYREIMRNSCNGEYRALSAQFKYEMRIKLCNSGAKKKLDDKGIVKCIQEKLNDQWTPEQIAGRSQLENPYFPCFKTIYRGN